MTTSLHILTNLVSSVGLLFEGVCKICIGFKRQLNLSILSWVSVYNVYVSTILIVMLNYRSVHYYLFFVECDVNQKEGRTL